MKKLLITAIVAGMGIVTANAQVFVDKAAKKSYKAEQQSARVTDASNNGKSNRALRHMDRMQKKADKTNKKFGKFK